jgi:hypothetical protein
MSALPRKRTWAVQLEMSTLGQKRTSPTCTTSVSFSGPHHKKSGKNTGVLQDRPQIWRYVTCGVNVRSALKKLGVLAIEFAIITLFVASLWWAADKNEAFSQDRMWLVD